MKIAILGLGYVGLPTAVLFANSGHEVVGVDVSPRVVEGLKQRTHHIEEELLDQMLTRVLDEGKLRVTYDLESCEAYIVAVPTPVTDHKIELKYLEVACNNIVRFLKKGDLVVIESTIGPGITEGPIREWLEQSGLTAGEDFYLTHMPERVLPGNIFKELTENGRVVGGITPESAQRAVELYQSFVRGEMVMTDATTAETVKVLENTYRDINIAIANEFLIICEKLNVNPWEAFAIANQHPRVKILTPGPGVGGHCIPVDPWFLVEKAPEEAALIKTARYRNNAMPEKVAEDIRTILKAISGNKVSIFGTSYKANTADSRETPTRDIVKALQEHGISLNTYDPFQILPWDTSAGNLKEAVQDVDLIAIVVAHDPFIQLTPDVLMDLTPCRHIFDCTNRLDKASWEAAGFTIYTYGHYKHLL